MKKSVRILLLSLLLSLALCGAAQAADDSGKLIPFPGDTWILTNNGSTEASISMKSMDFVVTDQDGTVRDRAVSWNKTISIPPGGQAIAHCAFSPTTNAIILPEGVTAVKSAVPRLLHADLNYRETCEFRNVTDHDANVLVSGKNKNWAYFIYNSGGAVKEESFSPNATYTDSHYEQLLTVPSGGRAVIVATGVIGPSTEFTVPSCMARAENFTLTYNVPLDWTFGYLGLNETVAFTNTSGRDQQVVCGGGYALYYAGGDDAALKEVGNGGAVLVPPRYSIALGCREPSGASYRFPSAAFETADRPGPVYHTSDSNGETTWTNISEHKAPVYGITKDTVKKQSETVAVYAFGARQNVVEATEDGNGIYIPTGGRLVITKRKIQITTLSGQFTVSGEEAASTDDYVVLRPGQLLTVETPWSASMVKTYGEPFYSAHTDTPEDANGDGVGTTIYEARGCAAIFSIPKDSTWSLSEGTMMETVTLSKGDTWSFTDRPGDEMTLNTTTLVLRGNFLCLDILKDWSYVPVSCQSTGGHSRNCCVLTALEDGCRIQYNRLKTDAVQMTESPFSFEVIPQGERRVYYFRDRDKASINNLCFLNAFGMNTEVLKYNWGSGTFTERAESSKLSFNQDGQYARKPLRITAAGSETVAVFLKENISSSDCLIWPSNIHLLSGGQDVEQLGGTAVDTVEFTLFSDFAKPFKLVLASYDDAGRLTNALLYPVKAADADEVQELPMSIPFDCGTDTAKLKLMAVDAHFRPLMEAVTVE